MNQAEGNQADGNRQDANSEDSLWGHERGQPQQEGLWALGIGWGQCWPRLAIAFAGLAIALGVIWGTGMPTAQAKGAEPIYCRDRDGHQICILSIKRSAKNFWEYRTVVSIDAQVQPQAIYDCLNRLWIDPEGYAEPFARHPAGPVICQIFQRKRYGPVPPVL